MALLSDPGGEWSNFSGLIRAHPERLAQPRNESELIALLQTSSQPLRVVGAGHSCTPLCATEELLLSLDHLDGIVEIDSARKRATIRAGTRIHDLGKPLREAGLALSNQGDVDVQAIAGAISTGTHGTGPELGSLSSQLRGLRLVLASGEVLDCSREVDPDIFDAVRVSLGALGVVTRVELQLTSAYNLHQRGWKEPWDQLASFPERAREHRHLEFFWAPNRDVAYMKSLDVTEAEPDTLPGRERECIGHSADIFPSIREIPFNEMEYALAADRGMDCFSEIRECIRDRHPDLVWPVEVRTLAADDAWLSPAYRQPSITISVHQGADQPHRALFEDTAAIFAAYEGRPHWGKFHDLEAPRLSELYPEWTRFLEVRRRLDPEGRLLNPYLKRVFGI